MPHDDCTPPPGGDGTGGTALSIRLGPSADEVRGALAELRRKWQALQLSDDMARRAELVLAEALNNVVEHAQRDTPDGVIELDMRISAGGMIFRIRDDGVAMPAERLPKGRLPDMGTQTDALPEGGFGWFLIHAMSDGLKYCRRPAGNCLCIHILDRLAAG